MSNVVFILGAGASQQCGAPLMSNFLDVANNLLRSNLVQDKHAEFKKVFDVIGKLQVVHSKAQLDLNNIESIFTVLELGKIIKKVPGLELGEIDEAIIALKELIVKTIEVTMKFPVAAGYVDLPQPYGAFGELLKYLYKDAFPTQTVAVISFNYDIATDMAMYRNGIGADYIIEKPDGYSLYIPLLKLHGSLNWAIEKEANKIRPLHLNKYLSKFNFRGYPEVNLEIGSQLSDYCKRYENIDVKPEPVIVPPSWNKADYHSALSDIWADAAKHLSEAEQIFIIGYSLPETDSFFRHLYALGSVGQSPLKRIAVFNPDDTGTIDKRFRSLLGSGAITRYEYHKMPFRHAIPHIKSLFPARK